MVYFWCFVLLLNMFQFRSQVMTNIFILQKVGRGHSLCMMARNMGCDLATRQRQDKDYVNFK